MVDSRDMDWGSDSVKMLNDVYLVVEESKKARMDLEAMAETLDSWLTNSAPVNADFCRYMGMMLFSLADRIDPD